MIKYRVVENKLTYHYSWYCQPIVRSVLGVDEISVLISNSLCISEFLARDTIVAFVEVVFDALINGNAVTLENIMTFKITLPGRLEQATDNYRGSCDVDCNIAKAYRDWIRSMAKFERENDPPSDPVVASVMDNSSFRLNYLSPGGAYTVIGSDIRLAHSGSGVWLKSPSGNNIKQINILENLPSRIVAVPIFDTAPGPAGPNSVEMRLVLKTRTDIDAPLKTSNYSGAIRTMNIVSNSYPGIFVIGQQSSAPVVVTGQDIPQGTVVVLVAQLIAGFVYVFEEGSVVKVKMAQNGPYSVPVSGGNVSMSVTDADVLRANVIASGRYLVEVATMNYSSGFPIVSFNGIESVHSPTSPGNIFNETNTNRQYIPIDGNRLVFVSRRSSNIAQAVVGEIASDGSVAYGSLSEIALNNVSLSSNTYAIVSIGNNKFARYRSNDTGDPLSKKGIAVFDCGESGTSISLLNNNNNDDVPYAPGGWRDCITYNQGSVYIFTDPVAPDYDTCYLQIADINNVTGSTSNPVQIPDIFGAGNNVYYVYGDMGEMRTATPASGGVLCMVRIADGESNTSLMFILATRSLQRYFQCQDADGSPLAISINISGVICFAYLTTSGNLRIRTGLLTGSEITFGDYIDLYNGATLDLYESDMLFDSGVFVFSFQNTTGQDYFSISADGSSVSCDDQTSKLFSNTRSSISIQLVPSGYSNMVMICNCGRIGSADFPTADVRYATAIKPVSYPVTVMPCASEAATGDISAGQWKFFKHTVQDGTTTLTIDLDSLTADIDLYCQIDRIPLSDDYDSSTSSGTDPEQLVISVSPGQVWYFGAYGYESGSGILHITCS